MPKSWFGICQLAGLLALWGCIPSDHSGLTIEPKEVSLSAGGDPVSFRVQSKAPDLVQWKLDGPGSISPATGRSTTYTPPATLVSDGSATLVDLRLPMNRRA